MTGPVDSVIGFEPATVLPRFLNALPTRFEVGEGPVVFNALLIDVDAVTGRALRGRAHQPAWSTSDGGCQPTFGPHENRPARRTASTCTATPTARTASCHRRALPRRCATAACGSWRSPTTTRWPGYRELRAAGLGRPTPVRRARSEADRAVEINSLTDDRRRCREGELHILGFGMDDGDAAFEAALERQRAGRDGAGRADAGSTPAAGHAHRRRLRRDRRRRRFHEHRPAARRPGHDRRRVTRRASTMPSRASWPAAQPGYVPRQGLGAARGHRGHPRRRRRSRCWRTSGCADERRFLVERLVHAGSRRVGGLLPRASSARRLPSQGDGRVREGPRPRCHGGQRLPWRRRCPTPEATVELHVPDAVEARRSSPPSTKRRADR